MGRAAYMKEDWFVPSYTGQNVGSVPIIIQKTANYKGLRCIFRAFLLQKCTGSPGLQTVLFIKTEKIPNLIKFMQKMDKCPFRVA